jgi:hypothetical protein
VLLEGEKEARHRADPCQSRCIVLIDRRQWAIQLVAQLMGCVQMLFHVRPAHDRRHDIPRGESLRLQERGEHDVGVATA